MVKCFFFVLVIRIIYFEICRTSKSTTDDLSVTPGSSPNLDEIDEELDDKLLNNIDLLNDTQIPIHTKFRIRLNLKPYDLKFYNHTKLKIQYNFNEIYQLLELNQFEVQEGTSKSLNDSLTPTVIVPFLDTSSPYDKSCFHLEEKRIQLNERQATLIKWKRNLKASSSQLLTQKNSLAKKKQKILEDKNKLNEAFLQLHYGLVNLEKSRFQLEEERKKFNAEQLHFKNRKEQLKVREQELKEKNDNLSDVYAQTSNITIKLNTDYSKLSSAVNQYNESYCNVDTSLLEHDSHYLELCKCNESLNMKIVELEAEKRKLKDYKLEVVNKTHHQLGQLKFRFQAVQQKLQESAEIIERLESET